MNHWYHSDMNYRGVINMLVMCGCVGQSGGGWAHYVGQEKLRPQAGWAPLAFALVGAAILLGRSVEIRGQAFTIVGVLPAGFNGATVESGPVAPLLEAHVLRGAAPTTGDAVRVRWVRRLRSERKFGDLAALQAQTSVQINEAAVRAAVGGGDPGSF